MIRKSLEEGVCTLRLDRAEKKNALTGAMYADLAKALEEGNLGESVRCHLICGQPGAFTAGNDIADFLKFAGKGDLSDTPVIRFLKAVALNEKPIVAAVDGLAIGVGTTLLMHCDMVFATKASTFKTPFVDLGLVPEAGSSLLAPRLMGHARAFELLCLGAAFDAERAHAVGIVNHIEEDVETVALACAKAIAAKPPQAMKLSRDLLLGDRKDLLARIDEEARIFGERLSAPETIAAFQAFMMKKPKG
ncbi:crotonase/enoyl-CoA hydratase family protein [Roseibium polysiphoniae]|uniref:Crotonase/enoyl-CoA hydratase family protein n=1 Tax=Roseibium polysiphoniae TaxID=2571221 RepID=A0ABR9CDC0_9HYPH|nr:crotonase/enoyl-CoA hydratase family protein [Roseibium polysiphoniae]MBD8877875.1 crotonase/enoyl-CoA hydratase family protein [Roseibium polysiphoniae]